MTSSTLQILRIPIIFGEMLNQYNTYLKWYFNVFHTCTVFPIKVLKYNVNIVFWFVFVICSHLPRRRCNTLVFRYHSYALLQPPLNVRVMMCFKKNDGWLPPIHIQICHCSAINWISRQYKVLPAISAWSIRTNNVNAFQKRDANTYKSLRLINLKCLLFQTWAIN